MAASASNVYYVANRKLTEVNPLASTRRDGPITFPAQSMVGYSNGFLAVVSNGQIYRLNTSTLDGTPTALPGSGPFRGMAMFEDKAYVLNGSCYYEIRLTDMVTTSSVC